MAFTRLRYPGFLCTRRADIASERKELYRRHLSSIGHDKKMGDDYFVNSAQQAPKFIETHVETGSGDGFMVGTGPVQIIESLDNHTFVLNEGRLSEVLLRPEVADKKVAVISVAGAFRKGKSFLLNFLLRFLQNKVRHHRNCTGA